ncbi:hypothetical protein [Hymenobacter wooponensis]|uniref:Uncharacterized protein n=1 Tax=Hymenobacter wooponensis TaxID=1525360 RepID=A0A4Z0MBD0_9BACT|nr:hypothetical protein [Hymenobacter wooponensis]TGD76799.1 hypothetical protein EU557_25165 [Hymenobacter wooponensis]
MLPRFTYAFVSMPFTNLAALAPFFSLLSLAHPPQRPQPATALRVVESSFEEENEYRLTSDSLIITCTELREDGTHHAKYARALTPPERAYLLAPFSATYLSRSNQSTIILLPRLMVGGMKC